MTVALPASCYLNQVCLNVKSELCVALLVHWWQHVGEV